MPREKSLTPPAKRAPRKKVSLTRAEPVIAHFVDPEQRSALIAEAAYFLAEKRGFEPGHEAEDWLRAEAEVDARLLQRSPSNPA
jgi:hypothetical protein